MVWFFGRGSEVIRVETRIDSASGDYLVEVAKPDGAVETERFSDRDVFQQRLEAIEAQLQAQSYVQLGAEVLPPGWRGPFTN
jgi:hypothetical protein